MKWKAILIVTLLFQFVPSLARGGDFPWKSGDAPPAVAGIRLGDGLVRLEAVLGKASQLQKLAADIPIEDAMVLTYQRSGVQVHFTLADGVSIIYLLTRAAGNIGGVRLGDSREDVLGRWGNPASVSGDGFTAIYKAGGWAVVLKLDGNNKVKQLGLGRATDKSPPGAKYYRKSD